MDNVDTKVIVFLIAIVLSFAGGVFVALSRRLQKVFFLLAVVSSMMLIADIQLGNIVGQGEGLRRNAGTVWGFRFTVTDLLALTLFVGLFVGSLTRTGSFRWLPRGSFAFWLLGAVGALSLLNAPKPLNGLFELNNLLLGFLLFVAISNFIRTEEDLRFAVTSLVLAVAIPSLIGFTQHYQYLLGQPYIYRIHATTPHPNLLAMYLNTLLPLPLVLALSVTRLKLRLLLLGVCVVGTASVIFTLSRGGVAALALGYGVALLLWVSLSGTRHKIVKLAFVAMFLVPVGFKWTPLLIERMNSRLAQASSTGRQELTDRAFEIWHMEPVLGVGINNYVVLEETANVHNTYMLFLAEMGVVGLAALVVLFGTIVGIALVNVRKAPRSSLARVANIGLAAGLAGLYLQLYAEFGIRSENIHYLFHVVAGVIAGSHALLAARRERPAPVEAAPAAPPRRREPALAKV
jgi:O-antigen ligase